MFLFVIALAIGLYLHVPLTRELMGPASLLGFLVLPKLAIVVVYFVACRVVLRRLARAGVAKRLRYLRFVERACHIALLVSYGADLRYGLLEFVQSGIGDLILIDELLVMLPPLVALMGMWAVYYPIDRRLRDARLIADMDAGRPVHPVWTRTQFLIAQLRHQIAFIFVPLCAILAIHEALNFLAAAMERRGVTMVWYGFGIDDAMQLVGVLVIILFMPVLIRHIWDTVPLPSGSLRDRLAGMCQMHRVGYRQLLLWRTFGGMSNAAVMGIIRPLRYILLTDALLENMTEQEIEAVMAHEIAHVRKHHIFWLLAVAFASISLLTDVVNLTAPYFLPLVGEAQASTSDVEQVSAGMRPSEVTLGLTVLVAWYFIFGWVSRRFERQADTFAVQHLSRRMIQQRDPADVLEPRVEPAAAETMVNALQRVADLNHMSAAARSWRHGSIVWRQRYLRTLPGQPLDELVIDQTVGMIKLATAFALVVMIASIIWGSVATPSDPPAQQPNPAIIPGQTR